jgi:hypothetical protein
MPARAEPFIALQTHIDTCFIHRRCITPHTFILVDRDLMEILPDILL